MALKKNRGRGVRDWHKNPAKQIAVANVERDAADGGEADAARGWRRFEHPVSGQTEPEYEAECNDGDGEALDTDVRADTSAHGVERATDTVGKFAGVSWVGHVGD